MQVAGMEIYARQTIIGAHCKFRPVTPCSGPSFRPWPTNQDRFFEEHVAERRVANVPH